MSLTTPHHLSDNKYLKLAYVFADHELVVLVMASSRTFAMVAAVVFLVCAILAWTPEAARMGQRGEVVAAAGVDGGGGSGNVRYWEQKQQQQQGFIGHRPRLASFTRRDGVALPNGPVAAGGGEDGGSKREVPSGPDPIHHPGSPSSAVPTTP